MRIRHGDVLFCVFRLDLHVFDCLIFPEVLIRFLSGKVCSISLDLIQSNGRKLDSECKGILRYSVAKIACSVLKIVSYSSVFYVFLVLFRYYLLKFSAFLMSLQLIMFILLE